MDLNILWFVLIAVLYIGFFFLEGFDFGVGILLPSLGKNDTERRAIINTIGPHWDGNEVWLLTAGGATFAAFPHWYATLFSGFYLAFFLLLVALIVRGVSFEFRSKDANPRWRSLWDWAAFAGSLVAALLVGVAFANLARGVPIDANKMYTGTLWTLLNPYGLLGGLTAIASFTLTGALFLSLKATDALRDRAHATARRLWLPTVIIALVLLVATFFYTDIAGIYLSAVSVVAVAALLLAGYLLNRQRHGWAFALMGIYIALALVSCFGIMFPRVLISTLNPAYSLTIYTASSSPYTLNVMTIVVLIFLPVVLLSQGWSYWIFRKRVETAPQKLTY
jgi:cytochrome bd ubiquinol oxidase subunit II